MRFFIALLGLIIFHFGFAQIKISAASKYDILDWNHDQLPLILKVNENFKISDLKNLGGNVGSQIKDVVTLRLNKDKYVTLSEVPGIECIQLARRMAPSLHRVIPDIKADSVYYSKMLDMGYTGKGVIIGVTDWGFDYTHPMFYDTAIQHTRIIAAWDQFKKSGPAPDGFNYGTEYLGEQELLNAQKDTINIYGYATHGTHVAGIAGGGGAGTVHRGIAYEADFLLTTFLVDEVAVIDAFNWMKRKADRLNKRLVINMSWGLYNLGPLDGTSLVSQAIDYLSNQGVVFVTSGGNNGDVNFHIKKSFDSDTLQSRIEFYSYGSNPNMWGQSIGMWGQENEKFSGGFTVYDNSKNILYNSKYFETDGSYYIDSFIVVQSDTIFFNVAVDEIHPLNKKSTIRLRIKNKSTQLRIGLKAYAKKGIVHFYNVTELTTDVGNWGMPFSADMAGWIEGDNLYGLGEPASTQSVITVAAYRSEFILSNGLSAGGFKADFSSIGPTIDERMKPDISAPGVSVASSVSSFTDRSYVLLLNASFEGKNYPFSRFSGTSMSSPVVAGVVALMLQANPRLDFSEVKEILKITARQDQHTGIISDSGSTQWGYGKINAFQAVKLAKSRVDESCCMGKLFPNPANDKVYLSSDTIEVARMFSIEGRFMGEFEISSDKGIDLSGYVPGMYLIVLNSGQSHFLVVNH
ncbi:MAG: S8 family serine peptidase [Bacteroidia bacterium]|nr:S8 family serine peptidase [Bacteroidia bacterium]MDG2042542.1 S8 family serine peptidase [Bacteroidia bacterium]|tara:strand:- start:10038 stop:12107 length:2070 start_codon:yes stop_codon:yes gene_type:complete